MTSSYFSYSCVAVKVTLKVKHFQSQQLPSVSPALIQILSGTTNKSWLKSESLNNLLITKLFNPGVLTDMCSFFYFFLV